jgi:hypothetical protein
MLAWGASTFVQQLRLKGEDQAASDSTFHCEYAVVTKSIMQLVECA